MITVSIDRVQECRDCGQLQRVDSWQREVPHGPHCVYCGGPLLDNREVTSRKSELSIGYRCLGCGLSFRDHHSLCWHLEGSESCRESYVERNLLTRLRDGDRLAAFDPGEAAMLVLIVTVSVKRLGRLWRKTGITPTGRRVAAYFRSKREALL